MTAREKFKVGDRVRMSERGLAQRAATRSTKPPTTGRVTGFARNSDNGVIVLRDGRRIAVCVHADWWEVDESDPGPAERAARKLVTALYLYPGHRVDSRGPAGCIMDALDEIAPEIAAEVRVLDAAEVFLRRWSEPTT